MSEGVAREISIDVGVVVRRTPGVTRWARHAWKAVAVLPGAGRADWKEMRREGDAVEYHAGTLPLTLYRAEAEAYVAELETQTPYVYVVFRPSGDAARPLSLFKVTASPYEAQDYCDTGEEIVEPVPMPPSLLAWVKSYTDEAYVREEFRKRKRRPWKEEPVADGIGDARIRQDADVFRTPASLRKERPQ